MAVVLVILAALFVCALAGLSARNVIVAQRLGKFTNRDGIEISRREDPIIFWLYILMGFAPLAICIFIGLGIAYLLFDPRHG